MKIPVVALFILLGVLSGCGEAPQRTDLTKEDYAKVQVGMQVEDFKQLFANHNISKIQSMKVDNNKNRGTMTYSAGNKSITIEFEDGRIVSKTQSGLK